MRANNLLQFIHQVTIEFRFRKSLAQDRFQINLEFRWSTAYFQTIFAAALENLKSHIMFGETSKRLARSEYWTI